MAGLYPLSRMQQFDSNGRPLSGARLFLFDGGTSTPRIGYKDLGLTSPHPNPILADSAGRLPPIYLDNGFYRHRLTTSTGTLIFDDDGLPVLSISGGGSGSTVDPDALFKTRDVKIRFDNQPLSGYVRLNGRTIGSAASGATERANADTQNLYEELWTFANIAVTGGKGASAVADFTANKTLVLPNAAGRGIFGADNLGAGAQGVLTTALVGADPTLQGTIGGAQSVLIGQNNIPSYSLTGGSGTVSGTAAAAGAHSHTFSGSTGLQSQNHTHTYQRPSATRNVGTDGPVASVWDSPLGTFSTGTDSVNHSHTFSGTTSTEPAHTHAVTGTASAITVSSGGSGAALNKLPPLITFTIYVRL